MLTEIDLNEAMAPMTGKTVAVVGNAADILDHGLGAEIDGHDIVIRMNRAMPGFDQRATDDAVGTKTTVLGCGVISPFSDVFARGIPQYLWWFKLTDSGKIHLQEAHDYLGLDGAMVYQWPQEMDDLLEVRIGAKPSSGIRVVHLLLEQACPATVDLYGFSFWGRAGGSKVNWHSAGKAHSAHSPKREYAYFRKLGFEKGKQVGSWRKRWD